MNPYDSMHDKLKDYRVTVDKDQLWAKTSHAIPKRKKRRGLIIFFIAALAGAGLIWLGISGITHTTPAPDSRPATRSSTTQELIASSEHTMPMHEQATGASSATTGSVSSVSSNDPIRSATSDASISNEGPTHSNSSSTVNSAIKSSNHSNQSSSFESEPTNLESQSTNLAAKRIPTKPASSSVNENEVAPPTPMTASSEAESSKAGQQPGGHEENTIASPIENPRGSAPSAETSITRATYLTETLPHAAGYPRVPEVTRTANTAPVVTPSKVQHHPLGFMLTQAYGVSWLKMTTSDPSLTRLTDAWETQMQSLENLNTTLHATYRLPSGLQFSSGLAYNRLTTQMQISNTTEQVLVEHGVTTIVIGEDGSIENLYGDVNVHQYTESLATYYSYHHTVNLEMMVQLPLIRKYRMELNAWVKGGYTLYYTSSGTTFDPEDGINAYTSENNPFHLSSPFSFGLGIGGLYRLDPSWSLIGRLGYQPLTYTHGGYDNTIQFHHCILDLGLGIGYTF